MNTIIPAISTHKDYDRFTRGEVTFGDLTERQYKALETVARLSPGFTFVVNRYAERAGIKGSSATHVMVWKDSNDRDYVGLVGKETAQYYDQEKATEDVVKRVAHRVYRFSGFTMQ
jgi:hypothetical protein